MYVYIIHIIHTHIVVYQWRKATGPPGHLDNKASLGIDLYMYVCMYVYTHYRTSISCLCNTGVLYICMYVCMYVCIYAHTHIDTWISCLCNTYINSVPGLELMYVYISHMHTHTHTRYKDTQRERDRRTHTHTYIYTRIHISI